jgi:hypothetical protein
MNPELDHTIPASPSDLSFRLQINLERILTDQFPPSGLHNQISLQAYLMHTYSPTMVTDPDDNYDNDAALEHQIILDDLASDNEDITRSDEEGWYYSDED